MQYIKAASAIGMASLNGHQAGSLRGKESGGLAYGATCVIEDL